MTKTRQEIIKNRPTSPHITIYRKQISSVLSIFHRLTGIGLFFTIIIASWGFIFWVFSRFDQFYVELAKSGIVKCILLLSSFAMFYHLCNGVRHLIWDSGRMFSIKAINITGWLVVSCSFCATLIFWLCL